MASLTIKSSENYFNKYHKILDADWDRDSIRKTISLMFSAISINQFRDYSISVSIVPDEVFSFISSRGSNTKIPSKFISKLKELSDVFKESNSPEFPSDTSFPKNDNISENYLASLKLLSLQLFLEMDGCVEFFQDLQSLLFLNCIHYLLPTLRKSRMSREENSLICVMLIHANIVWKNDPSHKFYLLASLMGYLGDKRTRLDFLEKSFSSTPVCDHSYLTKVNAYCGEMLEMGMKSEALELLKKTKNLLSNMEDIDEINEMIENYAA
jgi:hypothetical protein